MLGYFPNPLPDELFFSILARFVCHVGISNVNALMHELTSSCRPFPNLSTRLIPIGLARDVRHLVTNLPPGHGATAEELVDKYTLLPFWSSALPTGEARQLREWIFDPAARLEAPPSDSATPTRRTENDARKSPIRIRLSKLPISGKWRLCPGCVADDRRMYGECYWHRLHQIRSITICATHGFQLCPSILQRRYETCTVSYAYLPAMSAERVLSRSYFSLATIPVNLKSPGALVQLGLLEDITWLLSLPSGVIPLLPLRQRALGVALQNGLVKVGSKGLDVTNLCREVQAMHMTAVSTAKAGETAYGETAYRDVFDEDLFGLQCLARNPIWWEKLITGKMEIGNPIPRLLMIRAAGYTARTLFQSTFQSTRFPFSYLGQ